jgi:hypothetical protein
MASALTFGLADRASAAANTLLGFGGPGDFGQRYQGLLQQEQARDEFDATHRQLPNAIGGLLGAALMGKGAGRGGSNWSDSLAPMAKGSLGEAMSWVKTFLGRDTPRYLQHRTPLSRGYTVSDHLTDAGKYIESKFGRTADLSPAQRRAQQELAPNYRVDWWMPAHVGRVTGRAAGAAGAGGLLSGDTRGRRQARNSVMANM